MSSGRDFPLSDRTGELDRGHKRKRSVDTLPTVIALVVTNYNQGAAGSRARAKSRTDLQGSGVLIVRLVCVATAH
jgi:hypothetical protein